MIKKNRHILWTLLKSLAAGFTITLYLYCTKHHPWAAGFAIGGALSAFSLFSLRASIPALFFPGATRRSSAILTVALLMKLPIYAVGLYISARLGSGAPIAAFAGCTLGPCVITLEAIGKCVSEETRRQNQLSTLAPAFQAASPAIDELKRRISALERDCNAETIKTGDLSAGYISEARRVREGALE